MIKLKSIVKEIFDANLLENNVEITIEEYKHVAKEESQKTFEQLLNRFQNSLKFEEKNIDLLNNVKEALDFINTNEKIQKKLDK